MLFHKVAGEWKPIDSDRRLRESVWGGCAGVLLVVMAIAPFALAGVGLFALSGSAHPVGAVISIFARFDYIFEAIGSVFFVLGFMMKWSDSEFKSFQEIVVETLTSIDAQLRVIAERSKSDSDAAPATVEISAARDRRERNWEAYCQQDSILRR